jgi:hypothetical protein
MQRGQATNLDELPRPLPPRGLMPNVGAWLFMCSSGRHISAGSSARIFGSARRGRRNNVSFLDAFEHLFYHIVGAKDHRS